MVETRYHEEAAKLLIPLFALSSRRRPSRCWSHTPGLCRKIGLSSLGASQLRSLFSACTFVMPLLLPWSSAAHDSGISSVSVPDDQRRYSAITERRGRINSNP